ncbi:hypothetical protein J3L18_00025 [Mucilaginibacter gossypii]|uniref:hypothetical protein n=1 Tax=Mucilaginibacter gossypii TaxID=551996 RepID=UPI000DCCB499|nr:MULTISPECIES: hypothetical protein [Mucilaginibacter]QTE37489.1 hypothetical protein J3L18_00025 [Mucilaginibacter gossypii]RAV52314.1 hypothetical protein DIU36_24580 [Mucilaginibacter rubeus]
MSEKKKGPYKQTGNIAVDMVAACINHYEKQGRKVAYIRLDFIHWTMFKGYVLEQIPAYDLSNGEIEFDDVIVTQGSSLQVKPLYHELVADGKPKVYLMN